MPLERIVNSRSSWVQRAGYASERRRQHWLIALGGMPWLWFILHRDVTSSGFHWSLLVLMLVPTLATVWAATRFRCPVCRIPVYAFWLLGLPRDRERPAFRALTHCPYCLDDGSGETGDPDRVDRRRETRAAVRHVLVAVAAFLGVIIAVFVLMLLGWLPGYSGIRRPVG